MSDRLSRCVDVLADRAVPVGYSRLGYLLRRPTWHTDDPAGLALTGRVAVVTGANSGLGMAIVAGLAELGASVVMVVRDRDRGERARAELLRDMPSADLSVSTCDVSSLAGVREFVAEFNARYPRLDILVHNAGVLPTRRAVTGDGHELTLATHVLGPLLLTELLRPRLRTSGDPRVIWVSSGGMYAQPLRDDDPEYRQGRFRGAAAYARTKRMQVALLGSLARRYAGDGITVQAMHPGWADTPGVARSLPGFHRLLRSLLRDVREGSDTVRWLAATRPAPESGGFWHDRRIRPTHYLPCSRESAAPLDRLWRYCADAVAVSPEH